MPDISLPLDALLICARDAARMLAVSERTLWDWTSPRGTLACVRRPGSGRVLLLGRDTSGLDRRSRDEPTPARDTTPRHGIDLTHPTNDERRAPRDWMRAARMESRHAQCIPPCPDE